MRFAPTEDQIEFAAAVRSLLADTCAPSDVAAAWGGEIGRHTGAGEGDGRVRAAWTGLVEMGVLGLTVPVGHGGLGMTIGDLVPLLTECGRAALPDPLGDTVGMVAPLLAAAADADGASGESAARWLGEIVSGATVVTGFGQDPVVASGSTADACLLFGSDPAALDPVDRVTDEGSGRAATDRVVLVERSGMDLEPLESVDGSRSLARVRHTEGSSMVLAEGGDAAAMTESAFDRAALVDAATLLGLCDAMISMTVEYVSDRKQFGVPVGSFQAVKHHLADAASEVEFAGPLVAHAAHLLSGGHSALAAHPGTGEDTQHAGSGAAALPIAVSMAKARASRAAQVVAEVALQCHGAIGYTVEADLHLYMKRAWALSRAHGDAAWHRARVRRYLLGS